MSSYPDLGLTSPAQESWQAPKGSSVPIPPPPAVVAARPWAPGVDGLAVRRHIRRSAVDGAPLLWIVGAHGGAGASTWAHLLATRILLRGTQRRPRMTTQGHNLNVRTRKLSPVPSFRADRECGSSGPSTLTLRALSDRSLRAFRAASWALLTRSLSLHRASEQTRRWEITLA